MQFWPEFGFYYCALQHISDLGKQAAPSNVKFATLRAVKAKEAQTVAQAYFREDDLVDCDCGSVQLALCLPVCVSWL